MAITSQGYDGVDHEIDEVGWAGISGSFGSSYGVRGLDGAPDESAGRVTTVSSAERTVAVAAAIFYGHGVRDRSSSTINIQLPSVAVGAVRWFLVAARRDWQANATTIAAIPNAQSTKIIPSQRLAQPGVQDDQPLALVQITGGQSIPTAIVDLRCWSGNAGLVAASTDALAYLDRLGSRVTVGDVVWTRTLTAQGSPVWTTPAVENVPTVKPYVYADLRRSDSAAVVNNGYTDLKVTTSVTNGANWNTSWNGLGVANPAPGRWWVQATLATDIAGPRYVELNVKATSPGSVALLAPTSVDTAAGGFGRATLEGIMICPTGFAVSVQANNTGGAGAIRGGTLRAVWLGPV